jgi:hypothetical protein
MNLNVTCSGIHVELTSLSVRKTAFVFQNRLLSKISGFETEKKQNGAAGNYLPRSLRLTFFWDKKPHRWVS